MPTSTQMHWPQLLSSQRFKWDDEAPESYRPTDHEPNHTGVRTEFQIDHDRVVFSSAFRRLGRKTQVHPLAQHDHTHNRLTHSVEVASVGRSLGNRVGAALVDCGQLPTTHTALDVGAIVQVACLAHDIGNSPFGHTGEEAIRDWFRSPTHAHWLTQLSDAEQRDVSTYEGNAHTFRMLTSLEMYAGKGGMRLTSAVLGSIVKYPWPCLPALQAPIRNKFNLYQTELAYFRIIAQTLGLRMHASDQWARHPLSYLMEAADDICYSILDLEDAIEMGIIRADEFEELLAPITQAPTHEPTHDVVSDARGRCALLRGVAIGRCVNAVADCFMTHQNALLNGTLGEKDLLSLCPPRIRDPLNAAQALARSKIYWHRSKLATEIAVYPCIATLLDALIPSVHTYITQGEAALTSRQRLQLQLLETPIPVSHTLYSAYMIVLDFIGAMTDNAAATLAHEISGVGIL